MFQPAESGKLYIFDLVVDHDVFIQSEPVTCTAKTMPRMREALFLVLLMAHAGAGEEPLACYDGPFENGAPCLASLVNL